MVALCVFWACVSGAAGKGSALPTGKGKLANEDDGKRKTNFLANEEDGKGNEEDGKRKNSERKRKMQSETALLSFIHETLANSTKTGPT